MQRVPSDIVKGIFHFLGRVEFDADIPKIHSAFYEINKKIEGFDRLMNQFIFDDSKSFPYSRTISLALDRLQKSNLLHCKNPRLDKFVVSEKLASEESIQDLFEPAEVELLRKGAVFFQRQVQSSS